MALNTLLRGFKTGFKQFSESINKLVNTLLLSVAYLTGVGIVALISKIQKKKLLLLKHDKKKDSYYQGLMLSTKQKKEYYRQF
jgi:hypothetical protein